MKSATVLFLLALGCGGAFAAPTTEGQITMSQGAATAPASDGYNYGEVTMQYSSINNGSAFATVGGLHEFDNGFAVGARGYLPLQYVQAQAYMLQAVGRFFLMNNENHLYVDGTLTYGFFNNRTSDTASFQMLGTEIGFSHNLDKQFSVGGEIGVDFSPYRIAQDTVSTARTFYNKIAVTGKYTF
jgi:hypothetical protein